MSDMLVMANAAAREIWLNGDAFDMPTEEGIATLTQIIIRHMEANKDEHPL